MCQRNTESSWNENFERFRWSVFNRISSPQNKFYSVYVQYSLRCTFSVIRSFAHMYKSIYFACFVFFEPSSFKCVIQKTGKYTSSKWAFPFVALLFPLSPTKQQIFLLLNKFSVKNQKQTNKHERLACWSSNGYDAHLHADASSPNNKQ